MLLMLCEVDLCGPVVPRSLFAIEMLFHEVLSLTWLTSPSDLTSFLFDYSRK